MQGKRVMKFLVVANKKTTALLTNLLNRLISSEESLLEYDS